MGELTKYAELGMGVFSLVILAYLLIIQLGSPKPKKATEDRLLDTVAKNTEAVAALETFLKTRTDMDRVRDEASREERRRQTEVLERLVETVGRQTCLIEELIRRTTN